VALGDVVEVGVPCYRLAEERGKEQQEEHNRHAVVPEKAAHGQFWISPMAE
jgi:hypothetical protein